MTDRERSTSNEFVILMASLMSVVALTIDAMLPALKNMGSDLQVHDINHTQHIISAIFLGMSGGIMIYGPLADSLGRKTAIYWGMGIYLIGSAISFASFNLTSMLIGRLLQGFGGASCRIVPLAMIRDEFEGREMARVMSLIMIIFILVPALAPFLGQVIMNLAGWRSIYAFFMLIAIGICTWLYLRQPETLHPEFRRGLSISTIWKGCVETVSQTLSMGYTIASGLVFAAFVGYLNSSQQILQVQYQLGDDFAFYFGGLALAIGLASYANSKLVMSFGMERICFSALLVMFPMATLFWAYSYQTNGHPKLLFLVIYLFMTFFCLGLLFGNINTLAVAPLAHIAGIANSVIGSIQTLLSVLIGGAIGQMYQGNTMPLINGFVLLSFSALALLIWLHRKRLSAGSA